MARRNANLAHKMVSAIADDPSPSFVRPSDWNNQHNLFQGWNDVTGTTYAVDPLDHLSFVRFNNAAAVAVTAAAQTAGWMATYLNIGAGDATFTGSGGALINGQATLILKQNQGAIFSCPDGANFNALTTVVKASNADATAGTDDVKYMSAATTAAATTAAVAPKVSKGGDTMTGLLTLSGDPTTNLHAATKQYADQKVAKGGDTMTGLLTLSANPSAVLHAAPKQYVDAGDAAALGDIPSGAGRFTYFSGTQCFFGPFDGAYIKINGVWKLIPSGSVTFSNASLAASTLYYAYVWDNAGTLTAELSTTGRARQNDGTQAKSGDATRALVGMILTNASSQFYDMGTVSWFNRRSKTGKGFINTTHGPITSGTFVEVGAEARVPFVTWSDDAVIAAIAGAGYLSATVNHRAYGAVGFDSVSQTPVSTLCSETTAQAYKEAGVTVAALLGEGSHYATPMTRVGNPSTMSVTFDTDNPLGVSVIIRG